MKKIILIGMKGCGKTTIGKILAKKLKITRIELDKEIVKTQQKKEKEKEITSCREIFQKYGEGYFRQLERETLQKVAKKLKNLPAFILDCGGGTPLERKNQKILPTLGKVIFLRVPQNVLFSRLKKTEIPAFFPLNTPPREAWKKLFSQRTPIYEKISDIIIDCQREKPEKIAQLIFQKLNENKN